MFCWAMIKTANWLTRCMQKSKLLKACWRYSGICNKKALEWGQILWNRPPNLSQTKGLTKINNELSDGGHYIVAIRCIHACCSVLCRYKICQDNTCYHIPSNKYIPGDYDSSNDHQDTSWCKSRGLNQWPMKPKCHHTDISWNCSWQVCSQTRLKLPLV